MYEQQSCVVAINLKIAKSVEYAILSVNVLCAHLPAVLATALLVLKSAILKQQLETYRTVGSKLNFY